MTWVKLDDQFPDHPKVIQAGPSAAWLYVSGLAYASRYLTDGFVPSGQIRRLSAIKNADAMAQRLVDAGLWEAVDGGYQIHDYLDYNPSAEKVRETRAVRAKVGEKGGQRSGESRRASIYSEANGQPNDEAKSKQIGSPFASTMLNPVPSPTRTPRSNKQDRKTSEGDLTPTRQPARAPRVTLDDEPYVKSLVTKYGDVYSEEEVRDIVAAARGHPNYRKRDDKQSYVNNWILRDAKPLRERAKRWGNGNGHTNGRNNPSGSVKASSTYDIPGWDELAARSHSTGS